VSTPDQLQARVNTAGRMIAWGGSPVGAVPGGLLAVLLPIRLTFGLLTISVAVGAGLAGRACLGSRSLFRSLDICSDPADLTSHGGRQPKGAVTAVGTTSPVDEIRRFVRNPSLDRMCRAGARPGALTLPSKSGLLLPKRYK
jgi:hypothetical protein